MDAAQKLTRNFVLFLTSALLLAAPAWCALPTLVVPATVTVTSSGSNTANATSSDGTTAIPFTVGAPNYGTGASNWLVVTPHSGTTPTTLSFQVFANASLTPCSQATVTLTPTAGTTYDTTAQTITVIWANTTTCPGSGGGGGTSTTLTANPTSLNLTNTTNTGTVAITTNSSTAITVNASTAVSSTTNGINWLSAQLSSGSLTSGAGVNLLVTANPQNLTFGQSYLGTVTVTPSTGTALTIPVSFSVGTTSTGWSAAPNPVNLAYTTNSGTFPTQAVQVSTTTSGTTYNVGVTSSNGWLAINVNGQQFTAAHGYPKSTPFQLVVNSNANSLLSGVSTGTAFVCAASDPCNGSSGDLVVSIPVNLTVNGGTVTAGTWTANPNPVTFAFTTNSNFYPSQPVTMTPVNTSASTFNVGVSSFNSWLAINVGGIQYQSAHGYPLTTPISLIVSSSANTLTAGSYTGFAYVCTTSDPCSASATDLVSTITVNLTVNGGATTGLTIAPNPVTFSATTGSTAQQSQYVNVTSTTGGNLFVSGQLPAGMTFQVINQTIAAGGSGQFVIYANPTNLAATTYSGTLQVSVGAQTGTVQVNFTIGSNGGTTGVTAIAPTSMNFAYELGTSTSAIAQQKVAITGPAGPWASTITYGVGSGWLQISPSSGGSLPDPSVASATPVVSINPTGLAVGNYTATISISTTGGGSQNISVSLLVTAAGTGVLLPTPGSLIFTAQTGQAKPGGQAVFFSGSDSTLNGAINITASTSTPWISITATGSSFFVQVDQSTLTTGTYTGTISVVQANAGNSPVTIPVVIVVNGGGTGGTSTGSLVFSPTSLSFSSVNNATPASQIVSVSSTGSSNFTTSIGGYSSNGSGWLAANYSSFTTPSNVTVSVNPSGLQVGTYTASINFVNNGFVQALPVTLTVAASNTGNVTVTPATLAFTTQAGGNPASQIINVTGRDGSAGVTFTVQPTTTSGGSWLSTSASTNTLTANNTPVTVNISSTSLAAGTYNGNLAVTPNGGTVVNVPVMLTISAPATVTATPTSLTFNYQAGGATPAAQSISVSGGSAASSLAFSATAASTGSWLTVSPTAGTTPATLSASVNPGSLQAGQYIGTVTVAGAGSGTGSTTVTVTLNVTAPLPTLTKVTSAASFAQGSISPGEIISLFASDPTHPIGPTTTAGTTLDPTGKFVTTTLGGVQVLINGIAAPLTYVSAAQINAVVPYELAQFTSATVLVKFLGQSSNGITVNVATTTPALFTQNSSGTGPADILNSNGSVNAPNNPATRGDTVVVYMTGEGQTSPAGVTGKVTTVASPPLPLTPGPLLQVSVSIGGQPAAWSFAGEAPGFISGVLQLNVQVPTNISAGDQPIVVSVGSNPSPNGVTVSVK